MSPGMRSPEVDALRCTADVRFRPPDLACGSSSAYDTSRAKATANEIARVTHNVVHWPEDIGVAARP
jgi:hypothetical protein